MVKKMKKFVAATLVAASIISTFSLTAFADTNTSTSVTAATWMSALQDNISIKDITIPGTHDSGTKDIGSEWDQPKEKALRPWAITQTTSITEQLNNGIRLLDLRLSYKDGEIKIYHGTGFFGSSCNLTFLEAYKQIVDFLLTHPNETVIVTLKNEENSMSDDYRKKLNAYLAAMKDSGIVYTNDSIPTLGEVRGKIVLYNRLSDYGFTQGINYSNQSTIEDHFECTADEKKNYVEESLQRIENKSNDSNKIVVTYTSTNPISNCHAFDNYSWYDYLNPVKLATDLGTYLGGAEIDTTCSVVNTYLSERSLDKASCYGWFYMDKPSNDLIAKIYKVNFQ